MKRKANKSPMNTAALVKAANLTPTAHEVTLALAMRLRDHGFVNLRKFKQHLKKAGKTIVDADYRAFWASLATAGFGSISYTSAGTPSLFRLQYSLKAITNAALGAETQVVNAPSPEAVEGPVAMAPASPAPVRKKGGAAPKRKPVKSAEQLDKVMEMTSRRVSGSVLNMRLKGGIIAHFDLPSVVTEEEFESLHKLLKLAQ